MQKVLSVVIGMKCGQGLRKERDMPMYKFYCSVGCESDGEIYTDDMPVFCPSCGIKFDTDDVSEGEDEDWDDDPENWDEDEGEPWAKR
jgi:hypothetical protein